MLHTFKQDTRTKIESVTEKVVSVYTVYGSLNAGHVRLGAGAENVGFGFLVACGLVW